MYGRAASRIDSAGVHGHSPSPCFSLGPGSPISLHTVDLHCTVCWWWQMACLAMLIHSRGGDASAAPFARRLLSALTPETVGDVSGYLFESEDQKPPLVRRLGKGQPRVACLTRCWLWRSCARRSTSRRSTHGPSSSGSRRTGSACCTARSRGRDTLMPEKSSWGSEINAIYFRPRGFACLVLEGLSHSFATYKKRCFVLGYRSRGEDESRQERSL